MIEWEIILLVVALVCWFIFAVFSVWVAALALYLILTFPGA